jgi:hypothetical protein
MAAVVKAKNVERMTVRLIRAARPSGRQRHHHYDSGRQIDQPPPA